MLVRFKDVTDDLLSQCGGKGASLVKLKRAGLPVPDGYILTPGSDLTETESILKNLKGTYAVRSSAINEDGELASFAGAYETITDVKVSDIKKAVDKVRSSAENIRVSAYARERNVSLEGIAVVIQEFVKADIAGVIFTADPVSGSSARMTGNYVKGEGELLVSGVADAKEFFFDTMKYAYNGDDELLPYAKKLYRYSKKIRDFWGCETDIEWAISDGKLYILQARPITTITRGDEMLYDLNGSYAGDFLMTRTNVGEIFGMPVSPVTYSVQDKICDSVAMPHFIDNICGQAYLNVSVVASCIVSLGFSEKNAYKMIKDIVGKLPEGVTVPLYPVKGSETVGKVIALLKPKRKSKGKGLDYSESIIKAIDDLDSKEDLRAFWNEDLLPYIMTSLAEIFKGVNITGLFTVRNRIEKTCGEELANRLLTGCSGLIDSMKPLLLLEDLAEGKISKEYYIAECGHRHSNEMELMMPFPYENEDFPDYLIKDHLSSGISVRKMKEASEEQFEEALKEFDSLFPSKSSKIRKDLAKYASANEDRERVRNKGVKIFCALRKYLLRVEKVLGIEKDGIFMLYIDEILELLEGKNGIKERIAPRREIYNRFLEYPQFPNIILGRFDPDSWLKDPERRGDFYSMTMDMSQISDDSVKGFPGASGIVTGRVRVISDIKDASLLEEGEILVTCATNIGWTVYFPKAAAIVTDIGAPLSHAAIVAREFGIPAVVGCGNATTVLKTGDIVTVNGALGTVELKKD